MKNIIKFHKELIEAGLPCIGVSEVPGGGDAFSINLEDCRVDFDRGLTADEKSTLENVILNHDPYDADQTPDERITQLEAIILELLKG